MNAFIGCMFILVGFLFIPIAIIGLISPGKLAKEGEPPFSRLRIILTSSLIFFVCTAIGSSLISKQESSSQEQTEPTLKPSTDAHLIKDVRNKMASVENRFIEQQSIFLASLQKAVGKKNLAKSDSKPVAELLEEMLATLDQASSLPAPEVTNPEVKRHLVEAIDTHKKWAISQQAKINAFMNAKLDIAREMGDQADKLAMQEALALSLAYKAAGLPLE